MATKPRLDLMRYVLPTVWTDARWLRLPHVARCLYLYVVLAPENGASGVFRWDHDAALVRMGWNPGELALAERCLVPTGRVRFYRDGKAAWVWQVTRWALVAKAKNGSTAARAACEAELADAPAALLADWRARYPATEPEPVRKATPRRMAATERGEWESRWTAAVAGLELFETPTCADRGPDALKSWATAYPALDVAALVREAHAWLVANGGETKRPNTLRFLHSWMRRTASDAARGGTRTSKRWEELKAKYGR